MLPHSQLRRYVKENMRQAGKRAGSDVWMAAHSPINFERLHALGYMNFVWNYCEHELFSLFAAVSKMPEADAWIMVHDLGDTAIMTRIRALSKKRLDDHTQTLIENAFAIYEVCRNNRNQCTHFATRIGDDWELQLTRISKKPAIRFEGAFPNDEKTLRRVCNEIKILHRRIKMIMAHVTFPDASPSISTLGILRVPKPLWKPPPKSSTKSKRPPRSSA